jgi:hypothetical protein
MGNTTEVVGGIRIADMPDLGAFNDTSSVVGERAGSGRFGATALSNYIGTQFLPLAGGTLTGPLTLAADPAAALQAATKQYVDARPYIVATIAALRAFTTVPANAVWVQGYYGLADGGAGMFEYNAGDATTADNGGTIIVDVAGHRWVRQGSYREVTILQFGAIVGNTGDQTAAIQAAIDWAAAGGGRVRITPGNYRLTGTLNITSSNVRLIGDSMYGCILTFANGAAADCIRVGFQSSAINDVVVSTLSIVGGAGKTSGSGINASRIGYCQFSNVNISGVPNGIAVAILNNVWIDKCQVVCTTTGFACINWTSPANATDRSDVLTITDTVVNAQGHGQYGLHVDGMCQTLRVNRLGIIKCGYGLLVENSAVSNQYFPEFIYCDDMEIDGVDHIGIQISGGRQMHFVNTTVFNAGGGANTVALYIGSDGAASITNYLTFTNCALAGANHEGVICYARQVDFVNCYVGDNSIAGVGSYDGIALGNEGTGAGPAQGISFTGGRIGAVYGDFPNQRYGVSVGAGCGKITITGVDFSSCVTRAIADGSGGLGNVTWHGCIDINGVPLPDRMQQVAADPSGANLIEGMMWQNVTSSTLKVCMGGVVKTVTVT